MLLRHKQSTHRGRLSHRGWTLAVLGALLLQSLFPSGYMPASLSGGWVAMLCPEGLPAEFVEQLAGTGAHGGHHAHHLRSDTGDGAVNGDPHAPGKSHSSSSQMDYCPLGSGIDQPVTMASAVAQIDVSDAAPILARRVQWHVYTSPRRAASARAPPVS